MTPDLRQDRENRIPTDFEIKLQGLSLSSDWARPIKEITDANVAELKSVLIEAGFNLELSPEGLNSLESSQFRDLGTGKGPALVESLSRERAEEFFAKCEEIVREYPHVQKFKTGGVGLGLKHTLVDLIALSVLPPEKRPLIIKNINQRVVYGYKEASRELAFADSFKDVPKVAEPKKKATVPVGSIIKLWDFIVTSSK